MDAARHRFVIRGDEQEAGVRLQVRDVSASHGAVPALHGVSLDVDAGEVVALLGANGSGRTTLLRTVCGLLRPTAGEVLLDGQPLHRRPPHEVVGAGLALVPEGRRVFARLSVEENLRMGAYATASGGDLDRALDAVLARLPVLGERRRQGAGTLSGGEQQLLALGRALVSGPRVLLLDEPTTGLAPQAVTAVLDLVGELAAEGTAVLLVEQDLGLALERAARGYVLETGRVVAQGTADELRADPAVEAAYLGD